MVFISYLKVIEEIFKVNFKKFDCGLSNKFLQLLFGDYLLLLLDDIFY